MTADETELTDFEPSDYDMTITRTFDAPRERVFEAWTDPEKAEEWWGPAGFTSTVHELDARPGGTYRTDMHAPDGTVYPDAGEFHEVEPPERLVFTSRAFEDAEDGSYGLEGLTTVTFVDRGEKTELTLEAEIVAARPEVAEALEGMEDGWSQSLDKLDERLAAH